MLWRCWLGDRKGIRPVKNWVVGCWRGYLSGARCRLAYGPADATVSCFSKIQIGFTFLVLAHLGSPRQKAIKRVCVHYNWLCNCGWHHCKEIIDIKEDAFICWVVMLLLEQRVKGVNLWNQSSQDLLFLRLHELPVFHSDQHFCFYMLVTSVIEKIQQLSGSSICLSSCLFLALLQYIFYSL